MNGFYIQIYNGLLDGEHQKKMGLAVWQYMWFLDRMTEIDEKGTGWILHKKPILLRDIARDRTGNRTCSDVTVSRNINKLKTEGYIRIVRTPYGLIIGIEKAKKSFRKKGGNTVDNQQITQKRFIKGERRYINSDKSNIDVLKQNNYKTSSYKLKIKKIRTQSEQIAEKMKI